MAFDLETYKKELEKELEQILSYWMLNTIDTASGGFIGQVDANNKPNPQAPKGSVLNSRILWTFSAAYNHSKNPPYLLLAKRAYEYLIDYIIDKEWGGVYWTVDYKGNPLDTKKQLYALAFSLYAFSEYYKCAGDEKAKQWAIQLYHTSEEKSYDKIKGGYIDAFSRDWKTMDDSRLSAKDLNAKKTMNTHLHILEAYTNLYRIWPADELKKSLEGLIGNFLDYIVDKETNHLVLFFDENWNRMPGPISFGHDIEAAWLLQEAAEVIKNEELINKTKKTAISIADAVIKGFDKDGGLWYEYEPETHHMKKEKHWWPQAEALVGYLNAYQTSGDEKYLRISWETWVFIKKSIIDHNKGEWFWGVDEENKPMRNQDKAGLWKCPYHNSRACLEGIERLNKLITSRK